MNQPEGIQLKGKGLETENCLPRNPLEIPFMTRCLIFPTSNHPSYFLMDILNVLSSETEHVFLVWASCSFISDLTISIYPKKKSCSLFPK